MGITDRRKIWGVWGGGTPPGVNPREAGGGAPPAQRSNKTNTFLFLCFSLPLCLEERKEKREDRREQRAESREKGQERKEKREERREKRNCILC